MAGLEEKILKLIEELKKNPHLDEEKIYDRASKMTKGFEDVVSKYKGEINDSNIDDVMASIGGSLYANKLGVKQEVFDKKTGLTAARSILGEEYDDVRSALLSGKGTYRAARKIVEESSTNHLISEILNEEREHYRGYTDEEKIAAAKLITKEMGPHAKRFELAAQDMAGAARRYLQGILGTEAYKLHPKPKK